MVTCEGGALGTGGRWVLGGHVVGCGVGGIRWLYGRDPVGRDAVRRRMDLPTLLCACLPHSRKTKPRLQ